jgi:hypothetical protein
MHVFQSTLTKIPHNELNLFSKINLFPSDYHLVNLRTLNENHDDSKYSPSKNLALILRRFAYDCDENYDNEFHFEQVKKTTVLLKIFFDLSFSLFCLLANFGTFFFS